MNTQTIPAEAQLRRRWAGSPIGYRVLNLDRSEFSAWTNDQVIETLPGHFAVTGGVEAPAAGGAIVWGLADQDIASAPIEPSFAPVMLDALGEIRSMVDGLLTTLQGAVATTQQNMAESAMSAQQRQIAGDAQLATIMAAMGRQLLEARSVIDQTHDLISTAQAIKRKRAQSLAIIEEYIESTVA